jgi:hypothetical protein
MTVSAHVSIFILGWAAGIGTAALMIPPSIQLRRPVRPRFTERLQSIRRGDLQRSHNDFPTTVKPSINPKGAKP